MLCLSSTAQMYAEEISISYHMIVNHLSLLLTADRGELISAYKQSQVE